MKPIRLLLLFLSFCPLAVYAQTAEVGGAVQDPSGAVIPRASVEFRNQDTGVRRQAATNNNGLYHIVDLDPGKYDATVQAKGFKTLTRENITFQVGDKAQIDFKMQVGDASQNIVVDGSGPQINTTDGSVSTVIDRQFVANIPLNGRSFQDLISMTPGVLTMSPQTAVYFSVSPGESGDFSINGQRTESNYYIVDGVAANVSAGGTDAAGNGGAGAGVIGATSALGTTQSLLSVDDLEEFRVESSSYSAEYGRSPGGQMSFVTRSGTNALHGSAYDYFRNGWFDANDWFNDNLGQPKVEIHQNDFGGTFGGPVSVPGLYKGTDKTFFFGSYEGLRLSEPVAASVQFVPDTYMREQAPAAVQPLLDIFPQPNGTDYGTSSSPSLAQFFQGYSVPASINSSSVRVDQTFTPSFSAFFRFADTPSSSDSRVLSALSAGYENVQTYTLGTTWVPSRSVTDQFRLGYSRSSSGSSSVIDSFGGAVPIDLGHALGSTTGVTGQNVNATVELYASGAGLTYVSTPAPTTKQQAWNLTDTADITHGSQQWKFGIDFRRIDTEAISATAIEALYLSAQSVLSNSATVGYYAKYLTARPVFNQTALFAQDDWRLTRRFTLSGGLRWEIMPPPHNATSPQPYTVIGNLGEPSTLALAPDGTPMWHTSWFSFAPRLGIAWKANISDKWETVVRAGGGVFFDTVSSAEAAFTNFGFSAFTEPRNVPMPFTAAQQDISISPTTPYSKIYVFPSHLQSPYSLQWNAAVEQGLGSKNTATVSYVGSAGRRLGQIQELSLASLNPQFGIVYYPANGVTSDYDALQTKFQRTVSKGITALASYTWSHSIDYGSNAYELTLTRGNSDFDVRNNFQMGITWDLPQLKSPSKFASLIVNGWGLDGRLLARSAYPITLLGNLLTDPASGSEYYTNVSLVPSTPIYLYGSQYPGRKSLNPAAFTIPSGTDPGNAPRNFARGFGETQLNFGARHDFALSERTHLQFRAEAFNIFNHPIFGYVDPNIGDATFGLATMTLNQSLGTLASQYQQGGPRSMQFALRIAF